MRSPPRSTRPTGLVRESDSKCVLEVGEKSWPFPIPVVKKDGQWFFDTEAGKDEILNRRIGENELATLQVCARLCRGPAMEYAAKDCDGREVLKFAQKIISSPGMKDGLYWPPELDGEISPLGPLAADAAAEGYGKTRRRRNGSLPRLLFQDSHAPGQTRRRRKTYNYVINGNMIGGFALVAWPAEYGESGRSMTFIVNSRAAFIRKTLARRRTKTAGADEEQHFTSDKTWAVSPD